MTTQEEYLRLYLAITKQETKIEKTQACLDLLGAELGVGYELEMDTLYSELQKRKDLLDVKNDDLSKLAKYMSKKEIHKAQVEAEGILTRAGLI